MPMRKRCLPGRAIALALPALLLSTEVAAQAGVLEEVIVTAQKREQNIRDVPVSVATMSEENLDVVMSAGVDVLSLAARVPSLYVESSNGRLAPRFYIRGLGDVAFDANAQQPVSVVYDDVVLENVSTKAFPIFDIESVEVLRGPQGTLFGRNTPAGVVKFDSRRPTEEFEGYVKASYGRFNFRNIEAAVGGALAPNLTARGSFWFNGQDDWIDNIAVGFEEDDALGGFDEVAGRIQLLWTPTDSTEVLLNTGYHNQFDGTQTVFRAGVLERGEGFTGVDRDTIAWDSIDRSASELEQWYITGKLVHDFGNFTLTSITGYRSIVDNKNQGDVDGGSITGPTFPGNVFPGAQWALETGDNVADHEQITQELRLASNELGRLDWRVGFYYFYEDIRIDQLNAATFAFGPPSAAPPVTPAELITQQFQETNAWAIFASVDYEVTDRLTAELGLRYSEDDKEHIADYLPNNGNLALNTGGAFVAPETFTTDVDDDEVTGDFSLTYMVNDQVNVYTRVAKGYKAPSILARDSVPDVGDAETIWSFEGGIKTELLDRRMRLNLTGFYFEMSDQQLPVVGGAANTIGLVNADETIGYGFEADLELAPNEFILLTAGLSLNETEINDSDLGIGVCNPLAPCTVLDPANPDVAGQVLIDGNPLPNAPEWIANTTLRLNRPAFGGEVYFLTDWFFRSEISTTLFETVEFTTDDRIEGGIRVGYNSGDGRYGVAVFGRNITNEEVPVAQLDFFGLNGDTGTASVNNVPMWGLEVNYNF